MARMSRSTRRSPVVRRKRSWARSDESYTALAAATNQVTDLCADWASAYGTNTAPPGTTVGGVLLDFSLRNNAARTAATDGVYLGLIVTNETSSTEIPDPFGDATADWIWRQWIPAALASGEGFDTATALGGPIRIRAKRRMDEIGMRLWLRMSPIGTTAYSGRLAASTLLILP
jgi:hypothetical protein